MLLQGADMVDCGISSMSGMLSTQRTPPSAKLYAMLLQGADIVDCCIDSMSGTTSQPAMGAIVNSLHGTDLDTGVDPMDILPMSLYW